MTITSLRDPRYKMVWDRRSWDTCPDYCKHVVLTIQQSMDTPVRAIYREVNDGLEVLHYYITNDGVIATVHHTDQKTQTWLSFVDYRGEKTVTDNERWKSESHNILTFVNYVRGPLNTIPDLVF